MSEEKEYQYTFTTQSDIIIKYYIRKQCFGYKIHSFLCVCLNLMFNVPIKLPLKLLSITFRLFKFLEL